MSVDALQIILFTTRARNCKTEFQENADSAEGQDATVAHNQSVPYETSVAPLVSMMGWFTQ